MCHSFPSHWLNLMEVCWFLIIKMHQLNKQAALLISIHFIFFFFCHGAVWRKISFSVFSVNFLRNLLYVQSSFNIEDILTYLTQFNTFITDRLFPWLVVLNTHKLSVVAVLSLALFLRHHVFIQTHLRWYFSMIYLLKTFFSWNHSFLFVFYFVLIQFYASYL